MPVKEKLYSDLTFMWCPLEVFLLLLLNVIVPGHDMMLVLLRAEQKSLQSTSNLQQLPVQKTMVGLLKTKKKFSQLGMNLWLS